MKKTSLIVSSLIMLTACAGKVETSTSAASLRSVLLQQLKSTHTEKDWFVPINVALEGVTAEQAMWRDSSGNHSVGQLAHHLLFWNKRVLEKFNGQPEREFSGNNDETFTKFDQQEWSHVVASLDSVMLGIEKFVTDADDGKLTEWYSTLANISTHNAYHTGQIVYVRKLQKTWDPEKGIK